MFVTGFDVTALRKKDWLGVLSGVGAGLAYRDPDVPMVCLSTAHPAKFGDAVEEAIGHPPEMPESFQGLAEKETRCEILAADAGVIKEFVTKNAL